MSTTTPRTTRTVLGLGLCGAVAAGLVWFVTRDGGERPPAEAPVATSAAAVPATTVEAVVEAVPVPETPAVAEVVVEKAEVIAPKVDILRVEAGGSALVAGTAAPGARVSVLAGDRPMAEVNADQAGKFVAMFEAGTAAEPRALTLESKAPDGGLTRSDQVMILLPEAPAPVPVADVAVAEVPAAAAPPPVAVTALLSPEGAEVTPAAAPVGAAAERVSLASISYADAGAVTLSGSARAGSALRAYVDDALAGESTTGPDMRWALRLEGLAAGTYRLRVDEIGPDGAVTSRIETPFRRGDGEAAPPLAPGEVSVIVQPGASLWTLARVHYGTGVRYTRIYDANADLIADPELIYPGEVFRLPAAEAGE